MATHVVVVEYADIHAEMCEDGGCVGCALISVWRCSRCVQMRPRQLDRSVSSMAWRVYARDDKCRKRPGGQSDEASDMHSGKTRKLQSTLPVDMKMKLPAVQHSCSQHLDPSAKIKLQLFPVDDDTRMRLEKDGHNPHLELTLKARKKISSVLKHIKAKWGSSVITGGDPILVPYIAEERGSGSNKWTLEDIEVTSGDVYAAIGYPVIFRLRYGWLPEEHHVNELSNSPSTQCLHYSLSAEEARQQYERVEKDFFNNHITLCRQREKAEMTNKDAQLDVEMAGEPRQSVENLDQAETTGVGAEQLAAWCDSLTNISIGGLFSEPSLHGRPSTFNSKINGIGTESIPPLQCTSDSFDALLRGFQVQTVPSNEMCLSIFDAEDTCMAFPFRTSSKGTGELTENACFKPSNQVKLSEVVPSQESPLQLCSALNNGESSLGLSGIKWTDTLGPFDLGLPSRKVVTEDTDGTGQGNR